VFVPVQAASFATITPAATGRAASMFNAFRQLGGAIGVAVGVSHRSWLPVSGWIGPWMRTG
jgi:hypothetical protein